MSDTQRKLRLQINNTRNPARKQEQKQQRNSILHAQRRSARDNAPVRLDHLASEVERLHDGAKMFRAVREMTRKPASKLKIQDDSGCFICNAAELHERVTHHFGQSNGVSCLHRSTVTPRNAHHPSSGPVGYLQT